jgi:hypothetical protein
VNSEKIILRILDSMPIAQRDNVVVAKFPAPPPEFPPRPVAPCGRSNTVMLPATGLRPPENRV